MPHLSEGERIERVVLISTFVVMLTRNSRLSFISLPTSDYKITQFQKGVLVLVFLNLFSLFSIAV